MLTREEAKQNTWKAHCNFDDPRKAIHIVIDQIFNDHEEQLKAKDEEIKDLHTAMIKLNEHYHIAKNDLKVELKAKDEEIERLICRAYHAEGYISDLHNHQNDKKFYDAKARSIVAMLFWEWKKYKRLYGLSENGSMVSMVYLNSMKESKMCFEKAYKMLKDNK